MKRTLALVIILCALTLFLYTYFYSQSLLFFAIIAQLVLVGLLVVGFFSIFSFRKLKEPKAISKTLEDEINARYNIEDRLIAKNKQLEWAERTARICYFQWNIETNEIQFSDGVDVVLGVVVTQLNTFEQLKELLIDEDKLRMRRYIESVSSWDTNTSFMFRLINVGKLKYIQMIGDVYKDENNIRWIRGTLQDITEQQMFIQSIEDKNETLKQIAWMQSHEVRGPLATILGLTSLLNPDSISDDDAKTILSGIKEASDSLDIIVRKIVKKADAANIDLS